MNRLIKSSYACTHKRNSPSYNVKSVYAFKFSHIGLSHQLDLKGWKIAVIWLLSWPLGVSVHL